MPGQTEWQIAEKFFHIFDTTIYRASTSTPGLTYYAPSIPLDDDVFGVDNLYVGILVRNGIVEKIFADVAVTYDTPPGHFSSYMLPALLTTYGPPTEVRLSTYCCPFEHNDLPFAVVLFYASQGIIALYDDNRVSQDGIVRGCPHNYPVTSLMLRAPNHDSTFEEEIEGTSQYELDYLSLEEATGMDVTAFYETFKALDNTTCLETPANLWP